MKKLLLATLTALLASCGGSNDDDAGSAATAGTTNGSGSSTSTSTASGTPTSTPAATSPGSTSTGAASPTTFPTAATASAAESTFLTQAYQDGQNEVALSTLALQRSANPDVRRYAQMMIDEHTRANTILAQLAQSLGVTLQNQASAEQTALVTRLSALSATDFDRAYMDHNLTVHRQDVTLFQQTVNSGFAANSTANAGVMDFAAATLPALKLHLAMAKEIGGMIDPRAFVVNAYQDGLGEIQLSQIALQRASNTEVRQFAQMMIDHHTAMNADISQVAQTKGITLPTGLPPEHAIARDNLTQLSGSDFDKAYMSHNVVVHNGDVNAARAQSETGTDPEIRALATAALPMLTAHLEEATTIYQGLPASFLFMAFQSGTTEILLSHLAMQNATSNEVRAYAQRMITEHMQANGELMRLATREGVVLPQVLPAEAILAHQQLRNQTGPAFDLAYMESNVDVHTKSVALFTDRAANEPDPELRAFAAAGLPELTEHLNEARRIATGLSGGTGAGTNGIDATGSGATGGSGGATTSGAADATGGTATSGGATDTTSAGHTSAGNADSSSAITSGT
jgi:predicted outer membrane protein